MMFERKKQEATVMERSREAQSNVERLEPKEIAVGDIGQLTVGQALKYLIPSMYGDKIYFIELNPQHPNKGKRYVMSSQEVTQGELKGEKKRVWESNKPGDIADWLIDQSRNSNSVALQKLLLLLNQ